MPDTDLEDRAIRLCDECGSAYFIDASTMNALCPECAHHLYGYLNCVHTLVDGHCSLCGWDGSPSKFASALIAKRQG